MSNLWNLLLSSNQLSGGIPSSLGNLTNLMFLYLDANQLSGSIPSSLVNLTNLQTMNLSYNALYAADQSLLSFLNSRELDWQDTQTVAPTSLSAAAKSSSSILVS